ITASPNTGSHFTSWTQSGTAGTFGSASSASTTFTMGKGNSTVTAGGEYETYNITLNRNCSTTATGSTSTAVKYNDTTLGAITVPTCSNATGTKTVSGFTTTTSSTNATITFQTQPTGSSCNSSSSPKTCSSTNSTSYTFNGWRAGSGSGTLVASTAATPVLQANISGYTGTGGKWTRTSATTLYAGWTPSTGSYSSITLPTITKTNYVCGWSTSSTAKTIDYESGASLIPSSNTTLYGICNAIMQKVTMPELDTLMPNNLDSAKLIDSRDGKLYSVTKIDDIYWMTQNLSLGKSTTMSLTSGDTNLNDSLTSHTLPASSTSGFSSDTSESVYNAGQVPCSSSQPCGGYYSYPAATAGTNPSSGDATSDICPKGWKLPSYLLASNLRTVIRGRGESLTDETFAGELSGYRSSSSFVEGGVSGNLWLSSTNGSNYAYGLIFEEDIIGDLDYAYRKMGFSIRCVKNVFDHSITYDANAGSDTVTNMPDPNPTRYINGSHTVTISNKVPVRTGYTFKGWCSASTSDGTCSGTTYNPNGGGTNLSYTFADSDSVYKTLYAMWNKNTYSLTINFAGTGINSVRICKGGNLGACNAAPAQYAIGEITSSGGSVGGLVYGSSIGLLAYTDTGYSATYTLTAGSGSLIGQNIFGVGAGNGTLTATGKANAMQTWTPNDCSAMSTGDITQLNDLRDSEQYYVGKLADGNCWMLDNLRLDLTNSTTLSNTTADNTNATSTTLNYLKNGGGTTSDKYPTAKVNNVSWTSSSQNSYSVPMVSATNKNNTTTSYGSGSGKIGVNYNYCAASAGSYCYGNGTSAGTSSGNATEDICPKGWRLPTGDASGETKALYLAYSSNATNYRNAFSLVLSGYFLSGSASDVGTAGNWFSSTRYSNTTMGYLKYSTSGGVVVDEHGGARTAGASVRCIFDNQGYLQDQTSSTMDDHMTSTNKIISIRDSRDNEPYLIGKLADNKYWFLDNLKLDVTNSTVLSNTLSSNTNATTTSLTRFKSGGGTTSDKYPTAKLNNVAWTSSSQNYYSIPMAVATYRNNTAGTTYGAGSGRIGLYYNFCAATAGSYCYGNGTSAGTSSGNATEDLCPTGWRLPTGNTSGEYQSLYSAYSSNATNFKNALSTSLTGFFNSGSKATDSYGDWWSSTRSSTEGKFYMLNAGASQLLPNHQDYRYYGLTIRCMKDNSSVPTMQDATASTLAAAMPNNGDSTNLIDSRDGKTYPIVKISGKYWMASNLSLGKSTTMSLTNADTNLNGSLTSYTLPTSSTSGFSSDSAQNIYNAGQIACSDDGYTPCQGYYSFAAATAGTNPSSGTAASDICPKGWRMPTQSELDITSLPSTANALVASPFYAVFSGWYEDSTFNYNYNYGYAGTLWSSSASSSTKAYRLFYGYVLYVGDTREVQTEDKRVGNAIRCIKK
ncbi:InlB B-repeat-containing protein, partial [Candidatus Saccharibacteria bacterium]|nr:InlB B-repeat-containing protein [Candidatus Saccharibacteria bacterium]